MRGPSWISITNNARRQPMCSENMPDKQVGKLRCSIGLAARYEVYHLCSRTGACLRSDAVSDGWMTDVVLCLISQSESYSPAQYHVL